MILSLVYKWKGLGGSYTCIALCIKKEKDKWK